MAIHDYRCKKCGKITEILERKDTVLICSSCNSKELEKIISASNFALKGSGWYRDGYSSKPKGNK